MMTNPFDEEDLQNFLLNLCPSDYRDLINKNEELNNDLKVALYEGGELYKRINKTLRIYEDFQMCIHSEDFAWGHGDVSNIAMLSMYKMVRCLIGELDD